MRSETVWIWGRHSVLEGLRAGSVRTILLAPDRKPAPILREIQELARSAGVPVREVPAPNIDRVAPGQITQGVAADLEVQILDEPRELFARLAQALSPPFLLVLDQIQDPHNFGALLRTADAAGVHAVVVPERRAAPLTGVVAKTSAGALSHLPIAEMGNLSRALDALKAGGIWTVGLAAGSSQPIFAVDLTAPTALVIGNEAEGMRRLTRERCDLLAHIPMFGAVESLNASVAGSIAMYEVVRQRLQAGRVQ